MPGVAALVTLVGGVAMLWGVARLLASRSSTTAKRNLGGAAGPAMRIGGAVTVGVVLGVIAPATSEPMYVAAAAVAAISAGAAIGLGLEVGATFAEPAYTLPKLRPCPASTRGAISAEAATAAAAGAALTAALAFGVRLLGPSDSGPVFLAAFLCMLFERWLDGAWQPHGAARILPSLLAGILGAGLGAISIILLP